MIATNLLNYRKECIYYSRKGRSGKPARGGRVRKRLAENRLRARCTHRRDSCVTFRHIFFKVRLLRNNTELNECVGIFPGHVLYEKLRKQNFTAINYHRDQLKCTPILNPVEFMIPSFPNLSLACVNFWLEQKYLFNLNINIR